MVSFWIYDVIFLVLFTLWVVWFLKTHKKNLSVEGRLLGVPLFMYRTQAGVKAINKFSDGNKKILNVMKFPIIFIGFVLMAVMLWMLGQTTSIYIIHPEITKVISAPPIAPLIPYFPKIFGMESFFPPFYFTYFLLALAIVAISHEFCHGIFMRRFGIKIKSTGIVFLGPMLGAFVEEEKKQFEKKKKVEQMTVLGAGVFANLLVAILFYFIYVIFFVGFFSSSGYQFNSYPYTAIGVENITGMSDSGNLTKITTEFGNFYAKENLTALGNLSNYQYLIVYYDSPAVKAQVKGAIVEADGVKIKNQESLREFLDNKNPGDEINLVTEEDGKRNSYDLILAKHPLNFSKAYLGVGHIDAKPRNIIQKIFWTLTSFKDSAVYYKPRIFSDFTYFIYYFIWWVMMISFLVALFNMLPLGILDGGRFFYLGILSVSRSEKVAKWAFKIMTYLILLMFVLMTVMWAISKYLR